MSRVFWDTNLFIYLFEGYDRLSQRLMDLRQAMIARGDQLLTALMLPFDVKVARIYALLRSDRSLGAPDAVQLASAAAVGVDLFITNDARLQKKRVEGIQFIVPLDRAPL